MIGAVECQIFNGIGKQRGFVFIHFIDVLI